ncbi:hypothetical protein ACMYSQ_000303 [Aspergillus niger]
MASLLRATSRREGITGDNTNMSQPVVNDGIGTCSLCSCLVIVERISLEENYIISHNSFKGCSSAMKESRHSLFHQQCDQCGDAPDKLLCGFCNHLRLRHITHDWATHAGMIELEFGRFRDIRERSGDCALCRMITQDACLERRDLDSNCIVQVVFGLRYNKRDFLIRVHMGARRVAVMSTFEGVFHSSQEENDTSARRGIWQQLMVDWSTIRTWLGKCDDEHDNKHRAPCDNGPLKSPPPEFRVIDIERGCVVMAPPSCRYATLSYVWGKTTDTYALATKSSIQALEEEGYLFKKPLPATIEDSIRVCIELKIRYLWIDRLCIVQDDTTTVKHSQINAMGEIYSHSYLTLVDLEGISMDHGLPGVSQPTAGGIYQAQGMSLRARDGTFSGLVTNSKWKSRGWTFQEAMLSPKLLLFADAGVLFECSQASQQATKFNWPTSSDLLFTPAQEYEILVNDFTSRTLTFNADILEAFSGIMHWKYGTEHYFGLPYCEFVKGMLWYPHTRSDRGTTVARSAKTGDSIFPTWSWSSVMGPVSLYGDAYTHALLGVWGIPSVKTEGLVHIIRPHPVDSDNSDRSLVQRLGVALAWKEGCFPEPLPPMLNVSTTWKDLETLIRSGWASVDKLHEEALGIAGINDKKDIEKIFSSSYMEQPDQLGALLAHTQSLRARMFRRKDSMPPPADNEKGRYVRLRLHSMRGDKIYVLIHSNPAHWDFLDHDYNKDPDTKLDVLAFSIERDWDFRSKYRDRGKEGQWYDSEGTGLFEYDHDIFGVNVLLVETRNGLSRRVAIGQVELHDWIAASPEFHNFTLV